MARCLICLSDLGEENVITLDCSHVFHATCLATWFRRNPSCPTCRALPEDSVSDQIAIPASMRSLTALLEEPLRAARRRGAPGAVRRAAQAFRAARNAVTEASRRAREHRYTEPMRSVLQQQIRLDDQELARRRAATSRALALLRAWEMPERRYSRH